MDIVERFIQYMRTGDVGLLIESDIEFEKVDLNVIVTEILDWLKLEHKRSVWIAEGRKTCLKPMSMNMKYSWCRLLDVFVQRESIFQSYFVIKGSGLDFNDDVTLHERMLLREKAYENYNPQKWITVKM